MCGIAGLYERSAAADGPSVDAMARALRHRGPDGESVWCGDCVCLGHTRLKVLDLTDAASQPMTSKDGAVTIVYNGEVYNYVELRAELEAAGRTFRSTGDTEVVLAAYLEWDVACFERFNGMFAVALWDRRGRKLVLARDQFGIKPLYLRRLGRALAFASEPRALVGLAPVSPDEDVVSEYLDRALVDHEPERTFMRGIERVPPGTVLTLDESGERRSSFWTLEEDRAALDGVAPAELEEQLRALFLDAVRLRLRSDVRLGTCLSGGVDSSAVVGALKVLGSTNLEAFTAWADGRGLDERPYAAAAADHAGLRSWTIKTDVELVDAELDATVLAQGEPFSSASMVVQRCVMRLAREHDVTVILDGQGGDELFAGYPGSFGPAVLDRLHERGVRSSLSELRAIKRHHELGAPGLAAEALRPLAPAALRDLLRRRREGGLSQLSRPPLQPASNRPPYLASQRRVLLERRGLPALLRYEDRNSMAFSLEARLPFLDPRLVRFAFALPSSQLVSNGETKWILRRALAPLLPRVVRERRDKVGFAAPEREWLAGPGYARAREVLGDPAARRRGYIDVNRALRLLERHRSGAVDASRPLWRAVNLELWLANLPS